jgi:hypothetical protein
LDWEKPATVSVNIQTDFMGKATFLGIDLSKVGLEGIANFISQISTTNKTSSLQAYVQPKETVNSQIDFVIPQTNGDTYWAINESAPYWEFDGTSLWEKMPNGKYPPIKIQRILNNGITISYNQDGSPTTEVNGVTPITYNEYDNKRRSDRDGNPLVGNDRLPLYSEGEQGLQKDGKPLLDKDGKRRYSGSPQALSYQVVKPLAGIDGKRPLLDKGKPLYTTSQQTLSEKNGKQLYGRPILDEDGKPLYTWSQLALLDKDGDPVYSVNLQVESDDAGNQVSQLVLSDDAGNQLYYKDRKLIKPIVDKDGNLIVPIVDKDGKLLDKDGKNPLPLLDKDGSPIKEKDGSKAKVPKLIFLVDGKPLHTKESRPRIDGGYSLEPPLAPFDTSNIKVNQTNIHPTISTMVTVLPSSLIIFMF